MSTEQSTPNDGWTPGWGLLCEMLYPRAKPCCPGWCGAEQVNTLAELAVYLDEAYAFTKDGTQWGAREAHGEGYAFRDTSRYEPGHALQFANIVIHNAHAWFDHHRIAGRPKRLRLRVTSKVLGDRGLSGDYLLQALDHIVEVRDFVQERAAAATASIPGLTGQDHGEGPRGAAPAAPTDGPLPPDGFRWAGQTVTGFTAKPWEVLCYVWGRRHTPTPPKVADLKKAFWSGSYSERSSYGRTITALNKLLRTIGVEIVTKNKCPVFMSVTMNHKK